MLNNSNFTQLSVFQNASNSGQNQQNSQEEREKLIYKTNPKLSTSSDGVYRSKVKIV